MKFSRIIALSAVALGTLRAEPPPVVDDQALMSKMIEFGTQQIDSGGSVRCDDLQKQLNRTDCALKLTAPAQTPLATPDIAARGRASVAAVGSIYKCKKCSKWHCSVASGFFISPDGVFVTCHHVVASADKETMVVMSADGKFAPVREVLAADARADVAILRAEGSGFTPAPFQADVPIGSPIAVFSHPDGRFFVFTQGIISRYFREPGGPRSGAEMFAVTADFARGSSGAPVFDASGNVAGMVSNTRSVYYEEHDGRQDNLQMVFKNCVPAKSILQLIKPPKDS